MSELKKDVMSSIASGETSAGPTEPVTPVPRSDIRFLVSYHGEVEYEYQGRRYNVRYWGWNDNYGEGVWENFIEPTIGCVRNAESERFFEYPPPEIVAAFPGFVGCRYRASDWAVEYATPRSRLVQHPKVPGYVTTDNLATIAREED